MLVAREEDLQAITWACTTCDSLNALHAAFLLPFGALSQVHQLEFILDSLVDEKDRSTQKRGDAAGGRAEGARAGLASTNSTSDGSSQLSLEISVTRPAEIEAALQQFVSPKVCQGRMSARNVYQEGLRANEECTLKHRIFCLVGIRTANV